MAWISLIFLLAIGFAQEPPKFLTKHSPESLRYISIDGRMAYVQKKPGLLGLVSSFRSVDFLSETSTSDFNVTGSRDKVRLAIEAIPNAHTEYNLIKNHKIFIVQWGNSQAKEVAQGRASRLHLKDEWLTYFNAYDQVLHILNLVTSKKYEIKLSVKANPFFVPEAIMINSETVIYTDVNEAGIAAMVAFNLVTSKSTIIYKASQSATRLELCRNNDYLALGEFPYEGVERGSKIMHIKLPNTGLNLTGYDTVYATVEQDVGNMVCLADSIFFIKSLGVNKVLKTKMTDAVRLDLKTQKVETKTNMGTLTQLLEMDGRVLVPFRGDFFVIEGPNNLGSDVLKNNKEELPIDI
jgi:hypothetical protein